MANLKNVVTDLIKNILPKVGTDTDALLKELLVARTAASAADSRKKAALKAIDTAGLTLPTYPEGELTITETGTFKLVATTKAPAERLDQALLIEELRKAGLSRAKITNAMAAATVKNKPATSLEAIEL